MKRELMGRYLSGNVEPYIPKIDLSWKYQINHLGINWVSDDKKTYLEFMKAIGKEIKMSKYYTVFVPNAGTANRITTKAGECGVFLATSSMTNPEEEDGAFFLNVDTHYFSNKSVGCDFISASEYHIVSRLNDPDYKLVEVTELLQIFEDYKKKNEKMVTLSDGRQLSESTVLEAMRQYVGDK